jgi:hypothetical protein
MLMVLTGDEWVEIRWNAIRSWTALVLEWKLPMIAKHGLIVAPVIA